MTKCGEWDPITVTLDGDVVWRQYGEHNVVVAGRDPPSKDAFERQSAPKPTSDPKPKEQKTMSRTDHTALLERVATFLGELLIDNRIDAEQFADAKALHDDLMAVVRHKPATPTCNKTWFVAGGRDERTCDEFAKADQVCAECGAARCAEHNDIGFTEIEGCVLCEGCQARLT